MVNINVVKYFVYLEIWVSFNKICQKMETTGTFSKIHLNFQGKTWKIFDWYFVTTDDANF